MSDWTKFTDRLPIYSDASERGLVEVMAANGKKTYLHWENAAMHWDWWRAEYWRRVPGILGEE